MKTLGCGGHRAITFGSAARVKDDWDDWKEDNWNQKDTWNQSQNNQSDTWNQSQSNEGDAWWNQWSSNDASGDYWGGGSQQDQSVVLC